MSIWKETLEKCTYTLPGNGKVVDDKDVEIIANIAEMEGYADAMGNVRDHWGLDEKSKLKLNDLIEKIHESLRKYYGTITTYNKPEKG